MQRAPYSRDVKVHVVDPSAYTPPYDHALCSALAAAGAEVELITSRFSYGPVPAPDGYIRRETFYRRSHSSNVKRTRPRAATAVKLLEHAPDMLRYRRLALGADVVHFQWLTIQQVDRWLLPSGRSRARSRPSTHRLPQGADAGGKGDASPPLVLTAHDVLPREPRRGQARAQQRLYERFDAIVVHSQHGRKRLIGELGVDPAKIEVIPHGVFNHLRDRTSTAPPPLEIEKRRSGRERRSGLTVLFFGLLRPYKGLDVLLEAWRRIGSARPDGAELWIVGMPRFDLASLQTNIDGVNLVPRFITDPEIPSWFEHADLVVLPYKQAEQSGVLFTALAFGKPLLLSDVGGFPEIAEMGAAISVKAGDPSALADALAALLRDEHKRARLASAAAALARPGGELSWQASAAAHLRLYRRLLAR